MINFHLFCHGGLHFDHCIEQVLEKFEFLALSIKRHWCGLDWSYCHRLWFILQVDQYIGQSVQGNLRCFRVFLYWGWQSSVQRDIVVRLLSLQVWD